jgi:hypothetical protein
MSILSQLHESGVSRSINGFFQDDRLYRYLNIHPSCGGKIIHSDHRAEYVPPIHWLPVELLAEIFQHYLHIVDRSQTSFSLSVQPHSQTTPFLLGQVCYYWRSITISMGDLWQSMYINTPRMETYPLNQAVAEPRGTFPTFPLVFPVSLPL